MYRFYAGHDIVNMPVYLLDILHKSMSVIKADEARSLAQASMLPHIKQNNRQQILRSLDRNAKRIYTPPEKYELAKPEDSEKLKQWLGTQGILTSDNV